MIKRNWMDRTLIAISLITILSGLTQIIVPRAALSMMEVRVSSETIYLFVMVSILTSLFGAALLHSIIAPGRQTTIALWASLQKICGASIVLI